MIADWDDLRVFLALARAGKLAVAARKLDVSHPTIARRIRSLEATVGVRLFDRLPDHFALTMAGEELLADAEAMEQAAESIHRRSAGLGDSTKGTVRISAGEAMSGFLARHLSTLRRNLKCVEFELASSHMLANLSRREADLMIREQVPDLSSIITRRLGRVAYAVYGHPNLGLKAPNPTATWIGFDDDHNYMPGQAWMHDQLQGGRPHIRVNNWQVLHEAVRSGTGLGILPCYLGDPDPGIRRIGPVLKDVAIDQWLLVHRDLRGLSRIRAVIDALVRLFEEERPALEGRVTGRKRAA